MPIAILKENIVDIEGVIYKYGIGIRAMIREVSGIIKALLLKISIKPFKVLLTLLFKFKSG